MRSAFLECFEASDAPQESAAPTFEDGFAAGFAAGKQEAEAVQSSISAGLADRFAEMLQQQDLAESRVLAALSPLFDAIVSQLLPAMAQEAIGPQIIEVLMDRAAGAVEASRWILVSQQDLAGVEQAIAGMELAIPAAADPALAPGQAIIGSAADQDFFDFAEVVAAIQGALAALTAPSTGDQFDG